MVVFKGSKNVQKVLKSLRVEVIRSVFSYVLTTPQPFPRKIIPIIFHFVEVFLKCYIVILMFFDKDHLKSP